MYHAAFDYAMLCHSARAFGLRPPEIWQGQCVMNWYAVVHGEPRGFADYRSQSLHTACQCLGISLPEGGQFHGAVTDALLTAHVMLRLAAMYHQHYAHLTPALSPLLFEHLHMSREDRK